MLCSLCHVSHLHHRNQHLHHPGRSEIRIALQRSPNRPTPPLSCTKRPKKAPFTGEPETRAFLVVHKKTSLDGWSSTFLMIWAQIFSLPTNKSSFKCLKLEAIGIFGSLVHYLYWQLSCICQHQSLLGHKCILISAHTVCSLLVTALSCPLVTVTSDCHWHPHSVALICLPLNIVQWAAKQAEIILPSIWRNLKLSNK